MYDYIALILATNVLFTIGQQMQDMNRLRADLLSSLLRDYDKYSRPVMNQSDTLEVGLVFCTNSSCINQRIHF